MRHNGILRTWHDDKGFGFIAPSQGGRELFVHISAFARDGSRPMAGETLSYELGQGKDGKPQAVNVVRAAVGATKPARQPAPASGKAGAVAAEVLDPNACEFHVGLRSPRVL